MSHNSGVVVSWKDLQGSPCKGSIRKEEKQMTIKAGLDLKGKTFVRKEGIDKPIIISVNRLNVIGYID